MALPAAVRVSLFLNERELCRSRGPLVGGAQRCLGQEIADALIGQSRLCSAHTHPQRLWLSVTVCFSRNRRYGALWL